MKAIANPVCDVVSKYLSLLSGDGVTLRPTMRHKMFFLLLFLFSAVGMQAQKLTVESMEVATMDLSASTHPRLDLTGQPCGLVKVRLAAAGAEFGGNVIKVVPKTGEYWVYMPKDDYQLVVRHPNFVPLTNYDIRGVEPKVTYVLTLLIPQTGQPVDDGMRYLAMTVEPKNAIVLVDGKPQTVEDGEVSVRLPMGSSYQVMCNGYATQEGTVNLDDDKLLNIRLESTQATLNVKCPNKMCTFACNNRNKTFMKRLILLLLSFTLTCITFAQELTVKSMDVATMDISASQYPRMDKNGQPCGLVKVQLAAANAQFVGDVLGNCEYKAGEYWVYMSQGSYQLKIRHPNFVPLTVNFRDYDIRGVEPKVTYVLTLLIPQTAPQVQKQKLIINYTPKDAMVLIDSKPYKGNGRVEEELPLGEHTYVIAATGYVTAESTVKLNGGSQRVINETLEKETAAVADQPTTGTLMITSTPADASVKVDGRYMGTTPLTLDGQAAGSYTVTLSADGYVTLTRQATVTAGRTSTVSVTMEQKPVEQPAAASAVATAPQATSDGSGAVETFTVGSVSFRMVRVAGGTFQMGSNDSDADSDEKPVHQVTLSDYYIGETEVTQALWEAVMGTTVRQQRDKANKEWPLRGEGPSYPMYYISWKECLDFIGKLNAMTGKSFRLPTEAEWEYAARGGNKEKGYKYSGSDDIGSVSWYDDNSGSTTHPVGTKQANELGLYDMSGNVWEWCQDWYGNYGSSNQTNPKGPSNGSYHVGRGGGWDNSAGAVALRIAPARLRTATITSGCAWPFELQPCCGVLSCERRTDTPAGALEKPQARRGRTV